MARIPFTKAQAVGNDFIVIEQADLNAAGIDDAEMPALARRICERHLGVGADGVEVVSESEVADAEIHLWNSDGSTAELSGNGTRCVAAYLAAAGQVDEQFTVATGAGPRSLSRTSADHPQYGFRMAMGLPTYSEQEINCQLQVGTENHTVTLVNVGNPQCAVFVDVFPEDWQGLGSRIATHRRFPGGSNVSFSRVVDRNTLDVRFWERGAGETLSSGTGSTGAATAGVLSGRVESPVKILTPAGEMLVEWTDDVYLTGKAAIIATGEYEL